MTMASILFWRMRERARSRRCSRSAMVMGTASPWRLLRAAMDGDSLVSDCGADAGCWASRARDGAAAAAGAARRKRRREGLWGLELGGVAGRVVVAEAILGRWQPEWFRAAPSE